MQIAGKRYPVLLVIVYAASLLAIATWPITAFFSLFMFDAPGSSTNPTAWTIVGISTLWPIIPILGVLASFLVFRSGRTRLAYVLAGVGVLPLVIIVLGFITVTITSWIGFLSPPKF